MLLRKYEKIWLNFYFILSGHLSVCPYFDVVPMLCHSDFFWQTLKNKNLNFFIRVPPPLWFFFCQSLKKKFLQKKLLSNFKILIKMNLIFEMVEFESLIKLKIAKHLFMASELFWLNHCYFFIELDLSLLTITTVFSRFKNTIL